MGDSASAKPILDTQLFRDAFNASPIGIAVENLDGQPLFVNPAFCRFLGFTEEELRRKHCVDFSPKEDAEKDWTLFQQLRAGSIDHYQLEKRYFRRDGSLVWGSLSISLLNIRPSPLVIAMVEDITEVKKARDDFESVITKGIPAGVTRCSRDLRYLWANGRYANWLQRPLDQIVGRPIIDVIGKDAFESLQHHFKRVLSGENVSYEQQENFNGIGQRWIRADYTPTLNADGLANGWVAVVTDITKRKQAEEARLRLAAIVESSEDAIISGSLDGTIVSWNAGAERMYGYTEAEVAGKPITILVPPELADDEKRIGEKLLSGERIEQLETVRIAKSGKRINVSLTISPIKDSNGKTVGISGIARDITDQKLAEDSLRASEERLRLAQQAARIGTFEWNIQTGVNTWTPELEAMYGLPPGGFGGTQTAWEKLVHRDDLAEVQQWVKEALKTGRPMTGEWRVVWADGSTHWITGRWQVFKNDSGEPSRMVGINIDITDRKRAEQELSNANERLRLALEAGSAGGWEYDLRTGKNVWFGTAHEQLGMTPDQTEGSREEFWDRVHEDDRERVQHALQVAREKHEEYADDFRVVWRNGTTHWLRSRGRFQYDANGEAERLLGISLDITEYKLAEEALLRYAAIVESSEDGIASMTRDGIIVTWNAGAQRMFGYTQNEAVGKPANIIVPPELRDQQKKILETLWAGGRIGQFESVRVSKTGRRIDVSLSVSPVKDSTGKIVGCAGIARDISTRKRAEQDLLSSEQRYRLLFERNVAGVAIASADARLLDCNDGWAHILGYESKDELLGRHASEFYFNPAERKPLVDELFEKHVLFSRELHLRRKDGTSVWVLFNAAVHSDRDTPIVQCTMIDISEWKKAEEALSGMTRKLIESQEQERRRIGRELHDDINQRLAMLAIELEQLESDPSDVQSRVQELRKQMGELSNDVQALSHDLHSSKLEYLGVVSGIKSWCKEFGERQKMEIDFKSDVSSVLPFDIGIGLFRVLQESLHNAVKHSGVKRIEVELREVSNEIHLIVSDLGRGFDVEAALQGKGLGLTSMRERVRLVNGTITIDSKPMGGTTIHVRVPLDSTHPANRKVG